MNVGCEAFLLGYESHCGYCSKRMPPLMPLFIYMSVGQANPWLIPSSSFFLNLHSVLLFLSPLWSYKHSHMMLAGEQSVSCADFPKILLERFLAFSLNLTDVSGCSLCSLLVCCGTALGMMFITVTRLGSLVLYLSPSSFSFPVSCLDLGFGSLPALFVTTCALSHAIHFALFALILGEQYCRGINDTI